MNVDCRLCSEKDLVLEETSHYKILAEKYPIIEGTVLITTREHLPCHAVGVELYKDELELVKIKVANILKTKYNSKLIFFEHGIVGQTIPHAHLHSIPTPISVIKKAIVDNPHLKTISLKELPTLYKNKHSYYLIEENNHIYAGEPTIIKPGYFRELIANAVGDLSLSNWKTFSDTKLLNSVYQLKSSWPHH